MHDSASDLEFATQATVFREDLLARETVLISGGGSGIGRASAWLCARLGAQVVIAGRTEAKLQAVTQAIKQQGLKADYVCIDIRERDAVAKGVDEVRQRYGQFDALINSAGGQFPQAAIDFKPNGWQAVIDTNLNGTWHMMQAAAKLWRSRDCGGRIVNIVVVGRGLHGVAHTRAARAGVIALSEAVAVEWAPLSIRVNCIAPGAVQTEGWAVYDERTRARYPASNPSMRVGSAWEIAQACVYLVGPSGGFITGEVLNVDGGGRHWGEVWTTGKPKYFADASRRWDVD